MSEGSAPFTMLGGEGVVCEGEVCFVPGVADAGAESADAGLIER